MSAHAVVVTTVGTERDARHLASELVARRLAACVQVVPGVLSTYRWKGAVTTEAEWQLHAKTRRALFDSVARAIRELHPYEVPEIALVPIEACDPAYAAWIDAETREP